MDTTFLRGHLNQKFDDVQFDAFCMDYFFEVYDRFSRGMRKDEKINLLLDHCLREPEAYQNLAGLLGLSASQAPPSSPTTSSPIPNPKKTTHLSFKQKRELVNLLLGCPSVSQQGRRQAIIDELRLEIKNNVVRNPVDRVDVMNLVKACLNYEDGLEELIEIVRFFEGNSIAMQKVDQFISNPQAPTPQQEPSPATQPQQNFTISGGQFTNSTVGYNVKVGPKS